MLAEVNLGLLVSVNLRNDCPVASDAGPDSKLRAKLQLVTEVNVPCLRNVISSRGVDINGVCDAFHNNRRLLLRNSNGFATTALGSSVPSLSYTPAHQHHRTGNSRRRRLGHCCRGTCNGEQTA